ncbi:MAG: hypothetical protein BAJALOKI2v1_20004 [Promethearchaeota archaeon]|nr:MAG: hypothetical protein BAJALOKI2v1_20004 [Candidatus Lokiarchaeota archaeon]
MRARACIKCKTYIVIHPENPENKDKVNEFESNHRGHTVITVDLREIQKEYRNIASKEPLPAQ